LTYSLFDNTARIYSDTVPVPPIGFVQSLILSTKTPIGGKIVELGCGSGWLSMQFAQMGFKTIGIDSSKKLLDIATCNDYNCSVQWQHSCVECIDIYPLNTDLFISYESFHLFPDKANIINKIGNSLNSSGYLCLAWCVYQWEIILKDAIVNSFNKYGIPWGEWGYQSCQKYQPIIESLHSTFGVCRLVENEFYSEINIERISKYLSSIGKAAILSDLNRSKLRDTLMNAFKNILKTDKVSGKDKYFMLFAERY
jgi:SAM-dependent methyltransferase